MAARDDAADASSDVTVHSPSTTRGARSAKASRNCPHFVCRTALGSSQQSRRNARRVSATVRITILRSSSAYALAFLPLSLGSRKRTHPSAHHSNASRTLASFYDDGSSSLSGNDLTRISRSAITSYSPSTTRGGRSAKASMMARRARVFGHRVEFGRDFTGIICASRDLDTPLPAADPVMARHVQQYLEPLLARVDATVCDKVRRLVYELLPSGRCSVERLASSVGMYPRALHRHLARDGETFSSIVDAARADLAQRYVKDRGRSLSDVAYLLGFSGPSAFSRWFRERFGCSPTSWRIEPGAPATHSRRRKSSDCRALPRRRRCREPDCSTRWAPAGHRPRRRPVT